MTSEPILGTPCIRNVHILKNEEVADLICVPEVPAASLAGHQEELWTSALHVLRKPEPSRACGGPRGF